MGFDWTPSWGDFTHGLGYLHDNPSAGLLLVPATYPMFALGAAINNSTGGASSSYNAWNAAKPNGSAGTAYSDTTQWLSGYSSPTPGAGHWRLPVFNDKLPEALDELTPDWLLPAAILAGGLALAVALR